MTGSTRFRPARWRGLLPSGLFAALALPLAGCGDGVTVIPARGVVKFKGEPLAGAIVTFTPANPTAGTTTPVAETDDQGRFALTTRVPSGETRAGAVAGEYKVTVMKFGPPAGMTEAQYQRKMAEETARQEKGYSDTSVVPPRVNVLPADYGDPAKTKFSATVAPGGANEFLFDIP